MRQRFVIQAYRIDLQHAIRRQQVVH
jgi:hypothetical protein